MTTKQEYEDGINALLGTSIQWSKLKQEEIVEFATLLNNPSDLIRRLAAHANVPPGQIAASIFKQKGMQIAKDWQFPVLSRLLSKIGEKLETKSED